MSLDAIFPHEPTHPSQIALRTYALAASLSLTPAVFSLLSTRSLSVFRRVVARELAFTGFPFATTLAVAGTFYLKRLWVYLRSLKSVSGRDVSLSQSILNLPEPYTTFLSASIASSFGLTLLQSASRRPKPTTSSIPFTPPVLDAKPSSTLDLTLLLLVRAIDAVVQSYVLHQADHNSAIELSEAPSDPSLAQIHQKLHQEKTKRMALHRKVITSRIDAGVFWLSCSKIMLAWFYTPQRLPSSYVKWISALAGVDDRLLTALRLIREKRWSYVHPTAHRELLRSYSQDLGFPAAWGDPSLVPAFGGNAATAIWKTLGLNNRSGIGGIPCELVHAGVGKSIGLESSCTTNALLRGLRAFLQAIAIYIPVHFIPVILTRPKHLLTPRKLITVLLGAMRSATFLSAFISSFYYAVCFTRTLALARLLPFISHDFWDSPHGCIFAGSLLCGSSIFIEHGARRGEMSLYVLPRAIRTLFSKRWLGNRIFRILERITFVLALSTLLTIVTHKPESLRGLSRWTFTFFVNGPNAGFWRRKRLSSSVDPTPIPTPHNNITTTTSATRVNHQNARDAF